MRHFLKWEVLWRDNEQFQGEVWMLNDALQPLTSGSVKVSYSLDGETFTTWGVLCFGEQQAQTNLCCGTFAFDIPKRYAGLIRVRLCVEDHPEMDSEYAYPCRSKKVVSTAGMLNV